MKRVFPFLFFTLGALANVFADALPSRVLAPQAVALGIHAEATVEAVQQATIAAQVTGRIVDVLVDAGQAVSKGELLMRIDAREAAQTVQAAQSQLAVAQAQFERSTQLRQQNFISQAGFDKAKADYDAAKGRRGAGRRRPRSRQCCLADRRTNRPTSRRSGRNGVPGPCTGNGL